MNAPRPKGWGISVKSERVVKYRQTTAHKYFYILCLAFGRTVVSLLLYHANQRYLHNIHSSRSFHPKVAFLLRDAF